MGMHGAVWPMSRSSTSSLSAPTRSARSSPEDSRLTVKAGPYDQHRPSTTDAIMTDGDGIPRMDTLRMFNIPAREGWRTRIRTVPARDGWRTRIRRMISFKLTISRTNPTTEFVDVIILSPAGSHGRPTSSRSGTRSRGCVPPVPMSMPTSWMRLFSNSSGAQSSVIIIIKTVPV